MGRLIRHQESAVTRFEPNLRIPGPTALPPSVREAGAQQMINHRGPEFAAMLARILDGMKPYFGTTSDVAMITTAGSGGSRRPSSTRCRPATGSSA
jgi:aspartate aminotransferase-like enzyme